MRRTVIDDPWGARWTVRARYDRHARVDSDRAQRRREPVLRGSLAAMLSPQPTARPGGIGRVAEDRWRAPVLVGARALTAGGPLASAWAVWQAWQLVPGSHHGFWVVELAARGRIRRGATWRVEGERNASRIAVDVSEGVRRGLVSAPDDALLIDVVDERLTVHGAPR